MFSLARTLAGRLWTNGRALATATKPKAVQPPLSLTNLPTRPKRPANAYNLFYTDRFEAARSSNPTVKITELSKVIAAQWKDLPKNVKQDYDKKAAAQMPKYKQQMEEYNAIMKRKVVRFAFVDRSS